MKIVSRVTETAPAPLTGEVSATVVSGALHTLQAVRVFGYAWAPAGLPRAVLYLLGMVGLALLLTAVYMVLPVGQVRFGHALIGGVEVGNEELRYGIAQQRGR